MTVDSLLYVSHYYTLQDFDWRRFAAARLPTVDCEYQPDRRRSGGSGTSSCRSVTTPDTRPPADRSSVQSRRVQPTVADDVVDTEICDQHKQ